MRFAASKSAFCLLTLLTFSLCVGGQDSTKKSSITWGVYLDTYFSYSFNNAPDHEKSNFIFNHKRTNEVGINLGLIKASYQKEGQRANFGLMVGTYPQYNLSSEPELLRHIYEANIGVKISKTKDLWIDAGIMPSHIGMETPVSKDCWSLTRSIAAENSPYYETGLKVSYKTENSKWFFASYLLNGWQKIIRPYGNNSPGIGTQVTFTPNDRINLNFSSFIGNDKPDTSKRWRYFTNLFGTFQISSLFSIALSFDAGIEQGFKGSAIYNYWFAPFILLRYQKNKYSLNARAEYFSDENGVIISLQNSKPFQLSGYAINVDRKVGDNVLFRFEVKYLKTKFPYFSTGTRIAKDELSLTTSLSFSLAK